jgi:hypothetical protein
MKAIGRVGKFLQTSKIHLSFPEILCQRLSDIKITQIKKKRSLPQKEQRGLRQTFYDAPRDKGFPLSLP